MDVVFHHSVDPYPPSHTKEETRDHWTVVLELHRDRFTSFYSVTGSRDLLLPGGQDTFPHEVGAEPPQRRHRDGTNERDVDH